MTAEIVNLRQARKRRDRAEATKTADVNRVAFGRSKADKRHDAAKKSLEDKSFEGKRRDLQDPDNLS